MFNSNVDSELNSWSKDYALPIHIFQNTKTKETLPNHSDKARMSACCSLLQTQAQRVLMRTSIQIVRWTSVSSHLDNAANECQKCKASKNYEAPSPKRERILVLGRLGRRNAVNQLALVQLRRQLLL